jgi:hypothetical protein
MHQFKLPPSRIPELKVGRRYHVRGYHTGNFTGQCLLIELNVAVFRVVEKSSSLKLGEKVEVYLDSALGAGVEISEG